MKRHRFYRFGNSFTVRVTDLTGKDNIHKELSRMSCESGDPACHIYVCDSPADFPSAKEGIHRGEYKGIPWHMMIADKDGKRAVYFYSAIMTVFLVQRVVLLPLIKKHMAEQGGFSLIGSSFSYSGKTYVLTGHPGAGKTRLMLEAVDGKGAGLIGDNELLVYPAGNISSVFGDLELRENTVKKTAYKSRLSRIQKWTLKLQLIASLLLLKQASFNIRVKPADLGITPQEADRAHRHVFVFLSDNIDINKRDPAAMVEALSRYEAEYRSLFGEVFFTQEEYEASKVHIEAFLQRCDAWIFPAKTKLDDLLALT